MKPALIFQELSFAQSHSIRPDTESLTSFQLLHQEQ